MVGLRFHQFGHVNWCVNWISNSYYAVPLVVNSCHVCICVTFQIDKGVVRPFVPQLLDALLVCFRDDSWPVRDGELRGLLTLC